MTEGTANKKALAVVLTILDMTRDKCTIGQMAACVDHALNEESRGAKEAAARVAESYVKSASHERFGALAENIAAAIRGME